MAKSPDKPARAVSHETGKTRPKSPARERARAPKVKKLKRTTEVVDHREGGDPSTS